MGELTMQIIKKIVNIIKITIKN